MNMSHAGDNRWRRLIKNSSNRIPPFLLIKHGPFLADSHFDLLTDARKIILALLENEIQLFFKRIRATHAIEIGKYGRART